MQYQCSGFTSNRLGVLRTKKTKRNKKKGEVERLSCSLVGLENKDTSKFEVGKCYEVLFFSFLQWKKIACALTREIS